MGSRITRKKWNSMFQKDSPKGQSSENTVLKENFQLQRDSPKGQSQIQN